MNVGKLRRIIQDIPDDVEVFIPMSGTTLVKAAIAGPADILPNPSGNPTDVWSVITSETDATSPDLTRCLIIS